MGFECIKGCSFCCSPIPIKQEVIRKHQDKQQRPIKKLVQMNNGDLLPLTSDRKCIFLGKDDRCMIYEDRPQICRDFAMTERHPCPFMKPNGKDRSEAKTKQIKRVYNHNVDTMYKQVEGAK